MLSEPRNPFTSAGALRPDHPLFRGRTAELDRIEQACLDDTDSFPLVYGGRQNGKTTLLLRLQDRLSKHQARGVWGCLVDFQQSPHADLNATLRFLARQVAATLPGVALPAAEFDLIDFLDGALANGKVQRLVALLDELATLSETTREALASVLRALHTARASRPALAKLQIVLAGGIELYRLAVVEASELRNICEIVRLGDLSEADAVDLISAGLGMAGMDRTAATALGQAVYERVGGHPYLTQRLGRCLAEQWLTGQTPDGTIVDELSWSLLTDNDALLDHLQRNIQNLRLEQAALRLLSSSQRARRLDGEIERLDLLGIARRAGEYWAPRNPLFSVALAEWLGLPLPDNTTVPAAATTAQAAALERLRAELGDERQALAEHLAQPGISLAERKESQSRLRELDDELARLDRLAESRSQPAPTPVIQPVPSPPRPTPRWPAWAPKLIHIPAGPFQMGSSDADRLADSDEKPQHRLDLPDCWIGKTPVTCAQFRPFVESDGYTNPAYWTPAGWQWRQERKIVQPAYWNNPEWRGDDCPVIGVSWFEAVAYCRWLSAQTGIIVRLPTEAEWEKAARGPDGRIWPWGNKWDTTRCNTKEAGVGRTTPVGRYPAGASPYVALDMAGNVFEWCATQWRKPYPYTLEDEWRDDYLAADAMRVVRGGSWFSERQYGRGAFRFNFYPRYRYFIQGLRVASHSPPHSES